MLSRLKKQALAQGAFFAGLMTAIGLLGVYIPPLFFLTNLLVPLPLAVLVRQQDLKTGLFALTLFAALLFLFLGPGLDVLILVLQTVPLALVLGLLFKNHASAGVSVFLSSLTLTVFTLLGLTISMWVTGNNLFVPGEEMKQAMEQAADWYARAGLTRELSRTETEQIFAETARFVSQLIPAHLVTWSIISAFLTYLLTRKVLRKLSYAVTPLPPFAQWQFPWYFSWGLIAGLGLTLAGDWLTLFPVAVLGKNVLCVSGFLYLIAGISVCSFYLAKWKIPGLVKLIVAGSTVFYLPFAIILLAVLGIMDTFVNLRRFSALDEAGKRK
ncbi:MAG: YybS family protein [Bacillota bacterium]